MTYVIATAVLAGLMIAALEWGRYHPAPKVLQPPEPQVAGAPPPPWIASLTTGELAELSLRLLSRMGYAMLAQTVEGDRAEVTATDASAERGHRILLRAFGHAAGAVTPERLDEAVEHARLEGATQALVIGVAGFTRAAQRRADALPLELVDGNGLAELLQRHLPDLVAEEAARPQVQPALLDGPRAPLHA